MRILDPIGDLITRIRNAGMRRLAEVKVPHSNMREAVLRTLEREGYIDRFVVTQDGTHKNIVVTLKYADGRFAITKITRVSKPGRRMYTGIQKLPRVFNGLGVSVLSTPKGVLSDGEARHHNVGGEVLFTVF